MMWMLNSWAYSQHFWESTHFTCYDNHFIYLTRGWVFCIRGIENSTFGWFGKKAVLPRLRSIVFVTHIVFTTLKHRRLLLNLILPLPQWAQQTEPAREYQAKKLQATFFVKKQLRRWLTESERLVKTCPRLFQQERYVHEVTLQLPLVISAK